MAYYPKRRAQESPYNHTIINHHTEDRGMSYKKVFEGGRTNTESGLDIIRQSVYQILVTPVGSRFFLPDFGCRLFELLFEPNDDIVVSLAEYYIRESLTKWEPRITLESVRVIPNQYTLEIRIVYINNLTLSKDLFNTYIQRG